MRRSRAIQLESLPKRKAAFIEPMECAPVTKLADGPQVLGFYPNDEGEPVAVVISSDLPAANRWEIDGSHDKRMVPIIRPTGVGVFVRCERRSGRVQTSAGHRQLRWVLCAPVAAPSPPKYLVSGYCLPSLWVGNVEPLPCSIHKQVGPQFLGTEPKAIFTKTCRIR